jgi:uncharacterized protein
MLYLQELAKCNQQRKTITLEERLPHFVSEPCRLDVCFQIELRDDFYLAHLHVGGLLHLQCQRCLEEFDYSYDNHTIIAICQQEARAEELLTHYECIVAPDLQVRLEDLIIDELHLYAPQFHPDPKDCSNEFKQFLAEKNGTY